MARTNPFQFIQQVRAEAAKVTWPTRRETAITTLMVFIMVALATVFFFVADQLMSWGVRTMLEPGRVRMLVSSPLGILAVGLGVGVLGYFAWKTARPSKR